MEWLNYHHLYYFWTVAREGSITKACRELRLAQPTISGQLRVLEEYLGEKLFERAGRGLKLTEVGEIAFRYADQIFQLGRELQDNVRGRGTRRTLIVGIANVVPKLVAYKLLEPARKLPGPIRLICREGRPERLFADLALHQLDVVLTDAPIGSEVRVKAYSHLLGDCGLSFFGSSKLALRYRKDFPRSLNGAPMLIPSDDSATRHHLDSWFQSQNIKPVIVGEFADSALLQIFGESGDGLFPMPTVVESEIKKHTSLHLVGRTNDITNRFYAISVERKLKHPAVVAISEGARNRLFS